MGQRFNSRACVLAAFVFAVAPIPVHAARFDSESSVATFISPPQVNRLGSLSSLTLVDGTLSLDISRVGNARFDIVSNAGNQGGKAASFGTKSLDPFFTAGSGGFIGNFSQLVRDVRVDFGDYGADFDTLTLRVFSGLSGTGTLLGTTTASIPSNSNFAFTANSVSVAATSVRSFTLTGTSTAAGFPNSVFLDNFEATAVPEPGSLALLTGVIIPGTWLWFRRRPAHERRRRGLT